MPTPGIPTEFRQVQTQSCPKRIEMNVPDQFLKVRVLVADNGFVPVLKQVSVPLVPPVERNRVTRKKPPHERGKAYRATSHQEMNMIGKQRPRVDARSRTFCHVPEPCDERLAIRVIPNDEALFYPTDDDVVQGTWGIQPGTSRHDRGLLPIV
jgi:hypothetical protein